MTFNTPANALAAAIALALAAPAAVAQTIYHEAFNVGIAEPAGCHIGEFPGGAGTYPFPAGWQLFNVDNRTPATQVAYVNDAWEVREDFSFNVSNCAACSTSWYSPAGQANDWQRRLSLALTEIAVGRPMHNDTYQARADALAVIDEISSHGARSAR